MTEFHVLSLDAGIQSTALYLMFLRGEIPQRKVIKSLGVGYRFADGSDSRDAAPPDELAGVTVQFSGQLRGWPPPLLYTFALSEQR